MVAHDPIHYANLNVHDFTIKRFNVWLPGGYEGLRAAERTGQKSGYPLETRGSRF